MSKLFLLIHHRQFLFRFQLEEELWLVELYDLLIIVNVSRILQLSVVLTINTINIPGALIGFLILLIAVALLGLLTAVLVLRTIVFLLIEAVFFSTLLDETLADLDEGSLTTAVGFAVITAFSDASLIYKYNFV